MSNINLYQDQSGDEKKVPAGLFGKGLVIGAVIFTITLAVYGGLKMYLRSLDQKTEALLVEEAASRKLLDNKDVNLAASFQQRLDLMETGKKVFTENDPAGIFQDIQNAMISGVVASDFGFQDKTLRIAFQADNFEILAKQLLSFKKSNAFQDVQVKSSALDEKGKVKAEITMALSSL